MGNLISDAIDDIGNGFRITIIIIVVIVVFVTVIPVFYEEKESIQEGISVVCGLDNEFIKIFEQLESISPEKFDDRTKQIYKTLLGGNQISECDAWYFYQQLDENNRKKLNLKDLVCNINDCIAK